MEEEGNDVTGSTSTLVGGKQTPEISGNSDKGEMSRNQARQLAELKEIQKEVCNTL